MEYEIIDAKYIKDYCLNPYYNGRYSWSRTRWPRCHIR